MASMILLRTKHLVDALIPKTGFMFRIGTRGVSHWLGPEEGPRFLSLTLFPCKLKQGVELKRKRGTLFRTGGVGILEASLNEATGVVTLNAGCNANKWVSGTQIVFGATSHRRRSRSRST